MRRRNRGREEREKGVGDARGYLRQRTSEYVASSHLAVQVLSLHFVTGMDSKVLRHDAVCIMATGGSASAQTYTVDRFNGLNIKSFMRLFPIKMVETKIAS